MKISNIRASKQERHKMLQIDVLEEAGGEERLLDTITDSKAEREGLNEVLTFLRPRKSVVRTLDRAERSLTHLIELLKDLKERGIEFMSLTEKIDTSTPGGKLIFHP